MRPIVINGKKKRLIPEEWEEATPAQTQVYLADYYLKKSEIYTRNDEGTLVVAKHDMLYNARLVLLYATLGFSRSLFFKLRAKLIEKLIVDEGLVDFYFTGPLMAINKFPKLKSRFKTLYGPAKISQLSWREFGFAEAYYHAYTQGNTDALDMFVATLYRPHNGKKALTVDVDLRDAFDNEIIESRLAFVSKIPLIQKLCVVLWYEHGREILKLEYERLFDSPQAKKQESRQEFNPNGWMEAAIQLTNDDLSKLQGIYNTPVDIVCAFIQQTIIRNEKLQNRHDSTTVQE